MTLQISPDATDVYPDATTATIFLKKSLISVNCFTYKAVPSLADDEKQDNHLWHLAQVMHRSASHPFSVHQAVRRIAILRDAKQWLETNSDATQLKRSWAFNLQKIEGSGGFLISDEAKRSSPTLLWNNCSSGFDHQTTENNWACNLFMRTSRSSAPLTPQATEKVRKCTFLERGSSKQLYHNCANQGGDRLQHYVRVTAHVTSVTTAGQYVAQSRRDYDDAVLHHNRQYEQIIPSDKISGEGQDRILFKLALFESRWWISIIFHKSILNFWFQTEVPI